ncbi:prolyl oligopeptidase family serine peptidase [Streptomyces sp. NPDC055607]
MNPHSTRPSYPAAAPGPVVDLLHGLSVPDPFRWLEDSADPATTAWARQQQRLATRWLEAATGRRAADALVERFALPGEQIDACVRGRTRFSERAEPGAPHPRLYAGDTDDPLGEDRPLWSGAPLARWDPSPDGSRVACQVIVAGREDATPLVVLDGSDGKPLSEVPLTRYSPVAWLPDSSGFYYVRPDSPGSPQGIRLHRNGIDHTVFESSEPFDRHDVVLWHGRWLCVAVRRAAEHGNETWLADLASHAFEQPELRVLRADRSERTSAAVSPDGTLYLLVEPGTPASHVVRISAPSSGAPHGRTLVPSDPRAPITHIAAGRSGGDDPADLLLVARAHEGAVRLEVHRGDTGEPVRSVPTPGLGTIQRMEWRRPTGRAEVRWTSWTVPPSTVAFDPLREDVEVSDPTGAAPRLEEWRTVAASADGTQVPVTLLRSCDAPAGPRPALLLGYGGFGLALTSSYESLVLAWVSAGGLVVLPELREAGRELTKRPTLEDLEAVADHLDREALSRPDQMSLLGVSNGGLVMAAAAARSPERYAAAVCIAPLTDMARYELSGLGPVWRREYGTAADPDHLGQLLSYSPYHAVQEGRRYPPTLLVAMDGDTRVDPLHARKLCARLQHADPSGGPFLLRTYGDSGHATMPVATRRRMGGDILTFLAVHTGLGLDAARTRP